MPKMIEPLLMTTVRVNTFDNDVALTGASGFFFQRDDRLFLVSSYHVFFDEPTNHRPNRLEIEVHTEEHDLGQSTRYSIPLYIDGRSAWRDARDAGGNVDVAIVEIDRSILPSSVTLRAFGPEHIQRADEAVEIGSTLLAIGFPLGFEDTLHHLPVARQAGLASSFGLRFKGLGYFLVDARTHRGISGAPVVMRSQSPRGLDGLGWKLLGIHSAKLESGTRDPAVDDALGLNSVWYADVLMFLTDRLDDRARALN